MEPTYLSFPLMNHINVNDYLKLIDITGEITELPIPALKALTERYRCKHDVKVHEQQWLNKLKQAAHLKIQALAEPYKSQRKELFDANFKELD